MFSMYLPLASIVTSTLMVVLLFVCGFLMLIVLLQRGEGGGLSGAFGGMGGDSAFGVKGDKTFKKLTAFVATLFVLLVVVTGLLIQRDNRGATATSDDESGASGEESPGETPDGGTGGGGGGGGGTGGGATGGGSEDK